MVLYDTLALISEWCSYESQLHCLQILQNQGISVNRSLYHLFGSPVLTHDFDLRRSNGEKCIVSSNMQEGIEAQSGRQILHASMISLRRWEMIQDATSSRAENDTMLSLSLFGAKRI